MNGLLDTVLNVLVFAFVAVLIWIYFHAEGGEGE
jgi:hypothetical protein